jgi:hypothetical protein
MWRLPAWRKPKEPLLGAALSRQETTRHARLAHGASETSAPIAKAGRPVVFGLQRRTPCECCFL